MIHLISFILRFILFFTLGVITMMCLILLSLILWTDKYINLASDLQDDLNPLNAFK